MINIVEENFGVFSGFKHFLPVNGLLISFQNRENISSSGEGVFIIDLDPTSFIDINAWSTLWCGLVEDLSGEWVPMIVSNIIVSHHDDFVFWDAILPHDVIGVTGIGLMSVVHPGVGSSN